ncbi:MAG: hypothetical protein UT05_C0015G0010 [Parcubacteria group bacterium GW2011_GWF2_38_76]|nr:MAG: hypothetical protein UT05_C0015G0010 [Parcubacteria group bacterium GW2011_GWF2_38_76]
MIVYSETKKQFLEDVLSGQIKGNIQTSFIRELGHSTGRRETEAWQNSMQFMNTVMNDIEIPDDAGVTIEYKIPNTSRRIDFILTGLNEEKKNSAIIIELKQWSEARLTDKDAIVETFVGGGRREVPHPSYQAWTYACLLEDYNEAVEKEEIYLQPCAYLHNYEPDGIIDNDFYGHYLEKAPLFLGNDAQKLRQFIKRFVKYGDKNNIMYLIENGRIRPSKNLADSLSSLLKGNQEFIMIDDQKIVYETAIKLALNSTVKNKNVLIVDGGPGTGKTVVAINLLTELTNKRLVCQYITSNSAPRNVYEAKLTGSFAKSRISNLFRGSGSFFDLDANTFDALIIDEAHRLNEKSGFFNHLGENQIKELINTSKFSVFFIDEDQRVTFRDIGEKNEIRRWAKSLGATITDLTLSSQFRCNGSDGYLAWLDNILQIKETADETLEEINYDFKVVDSPEELHKKIVEKNVDNKSRLVAGYCWNWVSDKDKTKDDIIIENYHAKWNLKSDGQTWIIKPNSVSEIGCIHTCQGLELDYVGVIIGPDLVVRDGKVVTDASKRASTDKSIFGYKKMLKEDPIMARGMADMIIRNTYRTLMTRGMKGCYIYCTDPETQQYFRDQLENDNKAVKYSDIPDGISITTDM